VYVKCPVCEMRVETEHMEELTEVLRGHMAGVHDMKVPELPQRHKEYCEGGTPEEKAVETFSGTDPTKLADEDRKNLERVTQFQEPRAGETAEERSLRTFSGHEHSGDTEETRRLEKVVEQFQEPRMGETAEERAVRTFSGIDQEKETARSKMLREEVGQFKYPRTGPECERGPGSSPQGGGVVHKMMTREESGFFMDCPFCDYTLHGETEEDLSNELMAHYKEHHQ
jgi:hypothetical protein